jgi:SecD/SecF fusion protein
MQNKGAIWIFTLLLALCCLFYLSFTWVVNNEETKAEAAVDQKLKTQFTKKIDSVAKGDNYEAAKYREVLRDSLLLKYYDDLNNKEVYNVLGMASFTYEDCKKREINLGLDLRGGINVVLEVSVGDIIKSLSGNNKDANFNKALENARQKLGGQNSDFVELFEREYTALSPGGNLAPFFQSTEIRNKIEYNANNAKVVEVLRTEISASLQNVETTLRSRIQNIGVNQPNIRSVGSASSGRVLVELPGAKNIEMVKTLLERTANLEFWETYDNLEVSPLWEKANLKIRQYITKNLDKQDTLKADSSSVAKADSLKKTTADSLKIATKTAAEKQDSALAANPIFKYLQQNASQRNNGMYLNFGPAVGYVAKADTAKLMAYLMHPEVKKVFPKNLKWAFDAYGNKNSSVPVFTLYALRSSDYSSLKPALKGDIIENAEQKFEEGEVMVSMDMKGKAADEWRTITKRAADKFAQVNQGVKDNEQKRPVAIAIVMDGFVFSAPGVSSEIPNGQSRISGSFSVKEAQALASVLKAGKLPAPARIVASTSVGATLGQDAIKGGVSSFIGAILLILVFMVLYYNRAGGIADVALFINIFFIMGVLASWGEVLTLPGIAGIILTIGLSVDANILIFERVREELALGKSNALAIREGFKHAMSSIIDSNVTLLILGIILFVFGTGPIQGFAATLIVGILSSLFAAVLLSRVIFEWFIGRKKEVKFDNAMTRNAFKNVAIDFVKRRKLYYAISTIVIALGVVFYFKNGGFNLGIDFKGGRNYQVQFEKPVQADDVKAKLEPLFGSKPEITSVGSASQLKISTSYMIDKPGNDVDVQVKKDIQAKLNELGVKNEIVSEQKVGPAIASDILYKAYLAVVFSCILMFIYIVIRFKKWQYGLGAVVALFHDVLVVLSCYTIFDKMLPFSLEIGQDFIAAILTVMGYTMTETVVVFDRIRERLAESGKSDVFGEERNKLINFALNSTLSRTILTSLTVFFVLLVIFIFGGDSIRGFTFALLIGRIIGTYSSLCISTPIVVDFERKPKQVKASA